MEGKSVKNLIVCVLVLGLVLEQQVQVEAKLKSCCPSTTARNIYNVCRIGGAVSQETCAKIAGCKLVNAKECTDPPYIHHALHPEDFEESDALGFCKMGCTSSVCSGIVTVVGSDDAVDRCNDACYRFCNKGDAAHDTVTVAA